MHGSLDKATWQAKKRAHNFQALHNRLVCGTSLNIDWVMYQNAIVRNPAWSGAMVCKQQHFCLSMKWLNKLKRLKNMSIHNFLFFFPFWLCLWWWWFKAGWKMLVLSNRLERIQHVHWLKTEVNAISSVDCKTKFRLFF